MERQDRIRIEDELKKIQAKDIMSRFAITVKEGDALQTVAHLMMRFKISGLPVVSEDGKIVGIVTATDLFRIMGETLSRDANSQGTQPTLDVTMTKNAYTVEKTTTLFDIILLMHRNNIHTIPVLEGNEIAGVVGRRDVLYCYYKIVGGYR